MPSPQSDQKENRKRPGPGRPSIYSEELADRICDELADGYSLVDICQAEDMPHRRTVLRWMTSNPEFATRIRKTREGPQADHLLETMQSIERQVLDGTLDPQAARVVIWSRQWRAAKMAPRKYGDKLAIGGDPENPLSVLLSRVQGSTISPVDKD